MLAKILLGMDLTSGSMAGSLDILSLGQTLCGLDYPQVYSDSVWLAAETFQISFICFTNVYMHQGGCEKFEARQVK